MPATNKKRKQQSFFECDDMVTVEPSKAARRAVLDFLSGNEGFGGGDTEQNGERKVTQPWSIRGYFLEKVRDS